MAGISVHKKKDRCYECYCDCWVTQMICQRYERYTRHEFTFVGIVFVHTAEWREIECKYCLVLWLRCDKNALVFRLLLFFVGANISKAWYYQIRRENDKTFLTTDLRCKIYCFDSVDWTVNIRAFHAIRKINGYFNQIICNPFHSYSKRAFEIILIVYRQISLSFRISYVPRKRSAREIGRARVQI